MEEEGEQPGVDLPDEVWRCVLAWLPVSELVRSGSLVCRRWAQVSLLDDSFWRLLLRRDFGDQVGKGAHCSTWRDRYRVMHIYAKIKQAKDDDFELLKIVKRDWKGKTYLVRHKQSGKVYSLLSGKRASQEVVDAYLTVCADPQSSPFVIKPRWIMEARGRGQLIYEPLSSEEDLGTFVQRSRHLSVELALFYAAEVLLGLEYLHQHNIIYGSLQPEEVEIDDEGHIRLTGWATCIRSVDFTDLAYPSPEVLQGQGFSKQADFWAYGNLLYEMLVGLPPFYDMDMTVMHASIMSDPLQDPDGLLSEDALDLISMLLERDPSKRECDVARIKAHPFFRTIDWDLMEKKRVTPLHIPSRRNSSRGCACCTELYTRIPADETPTTDMDFQGFTWTGN